MTRGPMHLWSLRRMSRPHGYQRRMRCERGPLQRSVQSWSQRERMPVAGVTKHRRDGLSSQTRLRNSPTRRVRVAGPTTTTKVRALRSSSCRSIHRGRTVPSRRRPGELRRGLDVPEAMRRSVSSHRDPSTLAASRCTRSERVDAVVPRWIDGPSCDGQHRKSVPCACALRLNSRGLDTEAPSM